jgi:lipopolysaccharide export system permease protein
VIINRYIAGQVVKPLIAICVILVIIFIGYSSGRYLSDAANGLLGPSAVLSLILLKAAIALEVLLPVSFYLSVVLGLAALHTNCEITALRACGVGTARILRIVFTLSLVLGVLVAALSLYGRPWAYAKSYGIQAAAEAAVDLDKLQPGSFFASQQQNRVFFVNRISNKSDRMDGVFVRSERDGILRVTYARQGYQTGQAAGGKELVLLDGYVYEFGRDGMRTFLGQFGQLTVPLEDPGPVSVGYKRKAAASVDLAVSRDLMDIAELQWRLSTPVSTVLLGLLGVLLSHGNPRRSKYAKTLAAVVIYAVYYNMTAMARKWVQTGELDPLPGIWWVPASLAVLLIVLFLQPRWAFRPRRWKPVPPLDQRST